MVPWSQNDGEERPVPQDTGRFDLQLSMNVRALANRLGVDVRRSMERSP